MRPKKPYAKRSALLNPTIVLELACHTVMGIALGLAFALALVFADAFGIATQIAQGSLRNMTLGTFVATSTLAFAIGTTLTGFVFTLMHERDRR